LKQYRFPATVIVLEAWSDEATFYIWNGAGYKPRPGNESFRYEDFDFSNSPWPDPKGMIEKLHNAGLRLILWQIPAWKQPGPNDPPSVQHDNDRAWAVKRRLCVMQKNDAAELEPYTIPPGHWFEGSMLPDWSNEETRRLWFAKRRYLLELGVDGFKTDGGEFIYTDELPDTAQLLFADASKGSEMVNGYAQSYINAYQDFITSDSKGGERTLFSRAAYTGQQATPMLWAGDQKSSFAELRSQLKAGLSAALSGIIFWGFDIGGFSGPLPSPELYLRATQMACFCPVMQWHSEPDSGQFGESVNCNNNERSPWNIASQVPSDEREAYLERIRFYHALRMKLLPYICSEAQHCVEHLEPLMRPLVYEWPDAGETINLEDEYLFGRNLLVAPVLEAGVSKRQVWLPPGKWREYFGGELHQGGVWIEAPAEHIPVFERAG
jgi:alpha-D-xyloside xylohydrolase